jgi:hypothetical protein
MTDPKRLLVTCDGDLERMLLRAGRAVAPEGARERALLAASAALAASGAAAAGGLAMGNAAAGLKVSSLAALKWVGVLGLAGAGVVTGAAAIRHVQRIAASQSLAPSVVASGSKAAPRGRVESMPLTPSTSVLELAPTAPSRAPTASPLATARSVPKAGDSTLPAELATLERARAALGAGEFARALSILDGYIDRFPHGAMAPEAAVLRIETLLKAGDRASATRFANAFLAIEPRSPYAARIRSLLASNP